MTRILNIRGVIVDSSYDCEWAASYIERGIITPESHFRRQLAEAREAGDAIEIRVCSQGGDVVAGGEIANAIREYPCPKQIVVGSFAASMAANIVLTAGCPVLAHRNSILLYHGAWSVAIGGSGAMEDEARILDLINEPIKEALVAHGVPPETVDRGFSEGRAYTMGAREALSYGIVDTILDDDAAPCEDPERLDPDAMAELQSHSDTLPIAAAAAWDSRLSGDAQSRIFDLEDRLQELGADIGRTRAALDEAKQAGEILKTERDALREELESFKAALGGARQEVASERARANALQHDLDKAVAAHSALTGRVLAPAATQFQTWPEAVRALGLDEALRQFPDMAAAYRAAHSRKPQNQP